MLMVIGRWSARSRRETLRDVRSHGNQGDVPGIHNDRLPETYAFLNSHIRAYYSLQ